MGRRTREGILCVEDFGGEGMNDNEKALIRCVVENNLCGAKKYAQCILLNNKAKANEDFCRMMLDKMRNSDAMELPPNVKGLLFVENPKETFNENRYYLSDREKQIADTILKMSRVSQKLSEIGVNYVNSTMLYGESGTGKTTFGKYIAYRLGLPFAYINFSRMIDSALGGTAKNISNGFNYIKQVKCVFMLDEVDAIGLKRGSEDVGEMSRIVIGLMQELDMLTSDTVLLGATNRIDIIDKALLRRFTIKNEVTRLSKEERAEMARKFFFDVGFTIQGEDFEELIGVDDTQAGLMNRMIMKLVNHYADME